MKKIFPAFIFLLLLIPAAHALDLSDNIYFTIENDTTKCIEIVLPDDAGIRLHGKRPYYLEMKPLPKYTWSDLSNRTISTDENNTAIIPVCFRSFGKKEGESAEPFTFSISSPGIPTRIFHGGVSVSKYPDIDMNENGADIFDIGFKKPLYYVKPGEKANLQVLISTQADIVLDLEIKSLVSVTPKKKEIKLGPSDVGFKIMNFTAKSSELGEYDIEILAKIRDCKGSFCSKQARSKLVVTENPPEETSWTVSVFPKNINVKALEPVEYQISVLNNGPAGDFDVSMEKPSGLDTDFKPVRLEIEKDEEKSIEFTVTPTETYTFYEMHAVVKLGELTKKKSFYLATNEMLTDAIREAEKLKNKADSNTKKQIDSELDKFYNKYKNSTYGEAVNDYSDFKSDLSDIEKKINMTQPYNRTGDEDEKKQTNMLWIVPLIIIIILVLSLVYYFKIREKEKFIEKEESLEEEF